MESSFRSTNVTSTPAARVASTTFASSFRLKDSRRALPENARMRGALGIRRLKAEPLRLPEEFQGEASLRPYNGIRPLFQKLKRAALCRGADLLRPRIPLLLARHPSAFNSRSNSLRL